MVWLQVCCLLNDDAHTAISHYDRANDEAGFIRSDEGDDFRNFLGLRGAFDGRELAVLRKKFPPILAKGPLPHWEWRGHPGIWPLYHFLRAWRLFFAAFAPSLPSAIRVALGRCATVLFFFATAAAFLMFFLAAAFCAAVI